MKKEYIVVTEHGDAIGIVIGQLSIEVNEHIEQGFEPIGGVSVVVVDGVVIVSQAMIG
jgi:hypothetical protein